MESKLWRWATASALLLTGNSALMYIGALLYAQSIRRPYNGISVSEELNLITGRISLWNGWFFSLLMLEAATLCWRAVLQRGTDTEQGVALQGRVKLSLLLAPLVSFLIFMLISYSLATLQTNNLESSELGISTPTPIRIRQP